jgi:hypothetical protein
VPMLAWGSALLSSLRYARDAIVTASVTVRRSEVSHRVPLWQPLPPAATLSILKAFWNTSRRVSLTCDQQPNHRDLDTGFARLDLSLVVLRMERSHLLSLEETVTSRYSGVGRSASGSLPVDLDAAKLW